MAERVFGAALAAGALSVDALKGSVKPFDPRLSEVRGQPGQIRVAAETPRAARRQRDPRQPRPLRPGAGPLQLPLPAAGDGRGLDLLTNAARTLTIEAGAVTDNPIVFEDEDIAISGGNFHAQPVAFAADTIAMAMCEVGSLSERRTAVLIDPKMSGLPAFLTDDGGVNSGLMIPQVTQAALVAENRSLAFPSSVDSVPTSAGQEDHVSMAPISARKAASIARNAAGIVAVELIAAAQGVDYHAPLKTSAKLQAVHAKVRAASARASNPTATGPTKWPRSRPRCSLGEPGPGVQPLANLFFAQGCQDLGGGRRPIAVVSVWLAIIVRNSMLARGPVAMPIFLAAASTASSCALVVTGLITR